MTKELFIALEISHRDLLDTLQELLRKIPGAKSHQWTGALGEKGPIAVKTVPDIIIIDNDPATGELLTRVRTIKGNFPQSALLVVSANLDHQLIIDVMKAGAAEYLVEPISERNFVNAIEEVRVKLASFDKQSQGEVYSFISSKGGVGSTVIATNSAVSLAMAKDKQVVLIDLSLQAGDASVLLDVVPKTSMVDISQNFHRLDIAFLRGVMINHNTGISFLAAPQNPEDSDDVRSEHVTGVIELARKLYDCIIIDCPSMHINECSVEAFRHSDKIFIVTDMSVPSVRNAARLCKLIRKFGIRGDRIEIILNRHIKDSVLSLGEIEKNLDKPTYWIIPNDFVDIVSSINRGIPLVKLTPGAPFSKSITEFIRKVKNLQEDRTFRGLRNFFGKSV